MATKFDVLADCLEARSRGEDPSRILAQNPEYRTEIEQIMSTVERVRRSAESFHRDAPAPPLEMPAIGPAAQDQRQHALRLAWGVVTMGYAAFSLLLVGMGTADPEVVGVSLVGVLCWFVWWAQCQPRPDARLGINAR